MPVSGPLAPGGSSVSGRIDRGVMRTQTPHIKRFWHLVPLALSLLTIPLVTVALLAATAPGPSPLRHRRRRSVGLAEGSATAGLNARRNDPLAIEAYFGRESYRPGTTAQLRFAGTLEESASRSYVGPEWQKTIGDNQMQGIPVTRPMRIRRIAPSAKITVKIGNWPTGLYFARLNGPGGRVGYAPFVVPPKRLGQNRVAVVMPTRTWQAYNFRDDDRDGHGDTWYATVGHSTARLFRPYLNRGVPPHFRSYDLHFIHWLSRTGKKVDFLSQAELDGIRPAALRGIYDVLVFPGHHEYVTTGEYDAVEGSETSAAASSCSPPTTSSGASTSRTV